MAKTDNTDKKNPKGKNRGFVSFFLAILFFSIAFYAVYIYTETRRVLNPEAVPARTASQQVNLDKVLNQKFPERTKVTLTSLPYGELVSPLAGNAIHAESAILIDTSTGSIIFEKNADEPIPPASLTKIIEMAVIFQAVEAGEVSLDDEVPLPPQSWAENLPSDASRMNINKGEHVTLRELLLGLAIASGNDASIACAYYICGNMQDFVARMNALVAAAGLKHTHFVESSGYSAQNITTARDFATFACFYINRYPFALSQFHSKAQLAYPLRRNLSDEQKATGKNYTIIQSNTNKLLGILKGCDGLKTGYIDESGYNISVTARRNGTRFLSVTMRGPGNGTAEGNKYRVQDNMNLFDYAFTNFIDYQPPKNKKDAHEYTVGLLGNRARAVRLVPALPETFTVPGSEERTPEQAAEAVQLQAELPSALYGEIECGSAYGLLNFTLDGNILYSIPLVADRSSEKAGLFSRITGKIVMQLIDKMKLKEHSH